MEHLTAVLSRLLSPGPTALWAAFVYGKLRNELGRSPSYAEVKARSPRLVRVAIFVALKTLNAVVSRLVINNGWKADKPDWNRAVVVVTGGVGGIGGETVNMLLENFPGVKIAVLDLAEPKMRPRTLNVRYYKTNISDPASIAEAAKDIRQSFGEATMIVNNAGVMRSKGLFDLSSKEFLGTLQVNTLGAFNVIREFAPALIAKNRGHIVTIASTAAFISAEGMGDYAASKAGVLALHENLTAELRGRLKAPNVRTTVICPVKVDTPLGSIVADLKDKLLTPTQKPWQIAERIVRALDSGLSQGTLFAPSYLWAMLPLIRVLPPWYTAYVTASSGLGEFSTDASRTVGTKAGYRILSDD